MVERKGSRFSTEIKYIESQDPGTVSQNVYESDLFHLENQKHWTSEAFSATASIEDQENSVSDKTEIYPQREFKTISMNQDLYEGVVVKNNLHGAGFYSTQRNGQKLFYDGLFYMNKLEGYGQIFYENGSYFQGSFKENSRYGPGILTYSNELEDVGFWNGFKLIRLAICVGNDMVPSLANSKLGKCKLASYRFIIPLCDDSDILSQTFSNHSEKMDNLENIFNLNIRNPKSLFFHRPFYDREFYGEYDCMIKVVTSCSDNTLEEKWSNDSIYKEVMNTERIQRLRNKIDEVNDNLQTFIAIRKSLSIKMNICLKCCEQDDKEATGNDLNPEYTEKAGNDLYDDSVSSWIDMNEISDNETIKEEQQEEEVSDVCTCDEEGVTENFASLEEQFNNIEIQERYYRNIRDELQKKLDNIEKGSNEHVNLRIKLVKVKEIWAWNNEQSLIEMQKHCFRHRNSEDMVNFNVKNLILGNRKEFGKPGQHEETCRKFLIACGKGNERLVRNCLRNGEAHTNLADAKGNTGLFFAVAGNQHKIISILTNYGAKLDQLNDEQLTPLSMTLLKYIAIKNNSTDWERSFLPEATIDVPELFKWHEVKSFLSLSSESSIASVCAQSEKNYFSEFKTNDAFQKWSSLELKKGLSRKSSFNASYIFDLQCSDATKKSVNGEPNITIDPELKLIFLTIMSLLNYGADPNACEVPFPPLFLSLFTENPDIVREIIKAKANINERFLENLSYLHIASLLPPNRNNTSICSLLAKYGCNPNARTSPDHWPNRKMVVTGNVPDNFEVKDEGKNPLHLLCLRRDYEMDEDNYFCSIAKLLIDFKINTEDKYLGHTPLSLAVISGNIKLVRYLLKSSIFNPYALLDYGMGNILVLFALKRFDKVLPIDKCKEVLTALFESNVNVLNKVSDQENAIVFAENCDNYFDSFFEKDTKKSEKGKIKPKPKKVDRHSQTEIVKEFLKNLGRQTIIKQIQLRLTQVIYDFLDENILEEHEILSTLSNEYLTSTIALEKLQFLFETKKIDHDRLKHSNVKRLLEFVALHKKIFKKIAINKSKSKQVQNVETSIMKEEDIETMATTFDGLINFNYDAPKYLSIYGTDDLSKYNVCFHCLRGKNKILLPCPRCQMIRFCSLQCNKLNVKLKTQHGCNIVYYDMSEQQINEISKEICFDELANMVRDKCMMRMQKIRKQKRIQEEEHMLEMWRADTYGTKFLQIKPLLSRAVVERKELKGNIGLLHGILGRDFRKVLEITSLYSLETLLLKLQNKQRSETAVNMKHSSSMRSSVASPLPLSEILDSELLEEDVAECSCKEVTGSKKTGIRHKSRRNKKEPSNKYTANLLQTTSDVISEELPIQANIVPVKGTGKPIIRKLNKLPERYQRFIEVIGTYFPEIDFSDWLLPYACYSGGQLYYKFCDHGIYKESYSFT